MANQINLSAFPKFGTMTGGSGLVGIFDNSIASTGYAPTNWGTVGFNCSSSPQALDKVVISSAPNGWDASGLENGAVVHKLYAKNGSAPSHQEDGVLLGSVGPIRDVNTVTSQSIYSSNWWTKWDYIWVYSITQVWTVLSDFKAFAPEIPVIGSERRIIRRRGDGSQCISRAGSGIPGLRVMFELTQPAAVIPIFKVEMEHISWYHGQNYWLSCGAYLMHRQAATRDLLSVASWSNELDIAGRNLNRDIHYERQGLHDAVQLETGFHEIMPVLNSNSYETSVDYLTQVLVEYGRGLNKAIVIIDPEAEVINL